MANIRIELVGMNPRGITNSKLSGEKPNALETSKTEDTSSKNTKAVGATSGLKSKLLNATNILLATRMTVGLATNAVFEELNYQLNREDNYLAENAVRKIKNASSKSMSLATSVASGALMGATIGGPLGALIGGVVFGGFNIANQAIKSVYEYKNFKLNVYNTNYDASFNSERLGLINGGRNTQN